MTYIAPSSVSELQQIMQQGLPINVIGAAHALGMNVFRSNLSANISGMLVHNQRMTEWPVNTRPSTSGWTIFVNNSHPENRQRFTIAHEIGHFVMHTNDLAMSDGILEDTILYRDSEISNEKEAEANRFAAALLMPFERLLPLHAQGLSITALANVFGVSEQAMEIRLGYDFNNSHLVSNIERQEPVRRSA